MARHLPTSMWCFYRVGSEDKRRGPIRQGYVQTLSTSQIKVTLFIHGDDWGTGLNLTRAEARMLARRLNECLEGTK